MYIAVLKQEGEGCDYTIGCGINILRFDTDNATKARELLIEEIRENYNYDEAMLESVDLYHASKCDFDLKKAYSILNKEPESVVVNNNWEYFEYTFRGEKINEKKDGEIELEDGRVLRFVSKETNGSYYDHSPTPTIVKRYELFVKVPFNHKLIDVPIQDIGPIKNIY